MTEKYFKYLIKQSLPLFGIILIGGSFFVTGLINLDNLPAYVFLLSAGVPFYLNSAGIIRSRRTLQQPAD